VSALAALAVTGRPPAGAGAAAGPAASREPILAQVSPGPPDAPRVMAFTWTLYAGMWAELDLRMAAGAEAEADVTVEGGEVTWNLHTHPPDAPPSTVVTLARGRDARATLRCAPESAGSYSYLFANETAGSIRLRVVLRLAGESRLEAVKP
jgi:hypothetical protein